MAANPNMAGASLMAAYTACQLMACFPSGENQESANGGAMNESESYKYTEHGMDAMPPTINTSQPPACVHRSAAGNAMSPLRQLLPMLYDASLTSMTPSLASSSLTSMTNNHCAAWNTMPNLIDANSCQLPPDAPQAPMPYYGVTPGNPSPCHPATSNWQPVHTPLPFHRQVSLGNSTSQSGSWHSSQPLPPAASQPPMVQAAPYQRVWPHPSYPAPPAIRNQAPQPALQVPQPHQQPVQHSYLQAPDETLPNNIDPNEDEDSAVAAASPTDESRLNVFDDHDVKLIQRWYLLMDDSLRHSGDSDDLQEWIKDVLNLSEQGNEANEKLIRMLKFCHALPLVS